MAADAAAPLRDLLDCSLCHALFHAPITLLCCGNSFCRQCLVHALRVNPSCPLCRAPCYVNAAAAKASVALSRAIELVFGAEAVARALEAVEDEEAISQQRMPLFILRHPTEFRGEGLPMPGAAVQFVLFEPRYLLMAQRCGENNIPFGLQPSTDAACGIAVSIMRTERHPVDGRLLVYGTCRRRYRLLSPPEMVAGDMGLYTGVAESFDDVAAAGDGRAGGPGALPAGVAADVWAEAWAALSPRARRALLLLPHGEAAAAALRDALVPLLARVAAALPRDALETLARHHGPPPPPNAPPERWSFYAADVLVLPPEAQGRAFASRSTLHRLLLCYAAVEATAAACAAAATAGPPPVEGEGEGVVTAGLDEFADLSPVAAVRAGLLLALRPRADTGGGLLPLLLNPGALLAAVARDPRGLAAAVSASPAASSLAVFLLVVALLLLLRLPPR